MTEPRALAFGSAAEQYERFRPGYPDALVDAVLQYTGRPLRSALEVGAGTGKATRPFAARGIAVTALEPDADMARVLVSTTRGLPVEPVVTTFERFGSARHFDLVYAAAAWHWTDPRTRWTRAAELLEPGGVLALFGGPSELHDPDLRAAVAAIESEVLPPDHPSPGHAWSVEDLAAAGGFADVRRHELPRVTTTTRDDHLGRLATVSAYLMLDEEARVDALSRVGAVLPDRVAVDATVHLATARRVE